MGKKKKIEKNKNKRVREAKLCYLNSQSKIHYKWNKSKII